MAVLGDGVSWWPRGGQCSRRDSRSITFARFVIPRSPGAPPPAISCSRRSRADAVPVAPFESGDALRNALHDWKLPIPAIVGYRSFLNQETIPGDTCLVFTEPVLDAWRIDYRLITSPSQLDVIRGHYLDCRDSGRAGAALIAE